MQTISLVCMLLISGVLLAGCTMLPGYRMISDTPDPVIGQWVSGEPPQSEMHMVFYENHSYLSANFFINRGEVYDNGNWIKIGRGSYSTQSCDGGITNWTYDAFTDVVYIREIPQQKYFRYRG
jgi:hypothetical protein